MENKKRKKLINREEKGITLIALVITIIVLLILAAISIATLTGDNGILTNTNKAKVENAHGAVKEAIRLEYANYNLGKSTGKGASTLIEYFQEKEIIGEAEEDGKYVIDVEKLLGTKPTLGLGTDGKDVYKLEEVTEETGISKLGMMASTKIVKVAETTSTEKSYKVMYYGKTESEKRELDTLKDKLKGDDQSEKKEMITFTVSHQTWYLSENTIFIVEYQCEKGMTWKEFINSKYNTKEYVKLIREATEGLFEKHWRPFNSYMVGVEIVGGPVGGGEFSSEINGYPVTTDEIITSRTYYDSSSAG